MLFGGLLVTLTAYWRWSSPLWCWLCL